MPDFLHNDPEFKELLSLVSFEKGIEFELKGGTSLSKGFGLINRLSEDIDIHIKTNYGIE
jgi:predicted nucleotidyltransferase component of viral defense system